MQRQLVPLDLAHWTGGTPETAWILALESGKVLYFPKLAFEILTDERRFLDPALLSADARNISLDVSAGGIPRIKGVQGDSQTQEAIAAMVLRFRTQAQALIHSLLPQYSPSLRMAPTSFRPADVQTRVQSWRADDKRLHIDAFVSRPNYGERILRVFTNANPHGVPRVWRVGEPFEDVARRFLPRAKPYSTWQSGVLKTLHVTKSLRSEYDHLMLQLHDGMKADAAFACSPAVRPVCQSTCRA
jgi:3-deoxy-D-manno-oct-2-ulosonic acid (Kdo) hydroxylase